MRMQLCVKKLIFWNKTETRTERKKGDAMQCQVPTLFPPFHDYVMHITKHRLEYRVLAFRLVHFQSSSSSSSSMTPQPSTTSSRYPVFLIIWGGTKIGGTTITHQIQDPTCFSRFFLVESMTTARIALAWGRVDNRHSWSWITIIILVLSCLSELPDTLFDENWKVGLNLINIQFIYQ